MPGLGGFILSGGEGGSGVREGVTWSINDSVVQLSGDRSSGRGFNEITTVRRRVGKSW